MWVCDTSGRQFWGKDLDHQGSFSVPVQCAINHEGRPYIEDDWDMNLNEQPAIDQSEEKSTN